MGVSHITLADEWLEYDMGAVSAIRLYIKADRDLKKLKADQENSPHARQQQKIHYYQNRRDGIKETLLLFIKGWLMEKHHDEASHVTAILLLGSAVERIKK